MASGRLTIIAPPCGMIIHLYFSQETRGARLKVFDADPPNEVTVFYLEDAFSRRRAVIPSTVSCHRCRRILEERAEELYDAWQWGSEHGVEIHARIGNPLDRPPALCGDMEAVFLK